MITGMNEEEWKQFSADTCRQMSEFIPPYVTPISKVLTESEGKLHGTGSYLGLGGNRYLVTNEHVVKELENHSLTHQFHKNENVYRLLNPAVAEGHPVDVAMVKIDDDIWRRSEHSASTVSHDLFAQSHNPVERELLFFAGYSGQRSQFWFGSLITPGTPYLTQESIPPEDEPSFDPYYHFSLHYRPDLATSIDGSSSLPLPPGFSGSLVWNTKRVECLTKGIEWSPELAEVTGILWGWSEANLFATKVEHLDLEELSRQISKLPSQ
jgi:hypothetical protein